MNNFIKELYNKYGQIIRYLFFGACAAVINTICYYVFYESIGLSNAVSTIIAWLAAVVFAFFTNKVFVFRSLRKKMSERVGEAASFFGCRITTGIMDVIIMIIAVDYLKWNSIIWKLISNVIVTIINYIASKFFIFKDKRSEKPEL